MPQARVDYEQMFQMANQVENQAKEFETLVTAFKGVVDVLSGVWLGPAAQAYFELIREFLVHLQRLAQRFERAALLLEQQAQHYRMIELQNRSKTARLRTH